MKSYTVYETEDGKRFDSLEAAEAWEKADKQWTAEFVFTYTKYFTIWAPSKEEAKEKAEKYADEIGNELAENLSPNSDLGWDITYVYQPKADIKF